MYMPCCLQGVPKKVWKLGKLNHVAIAVPDIDKATAFYRDILGAKVSEKYVSIIRLICIMMSVQWSFFNSAM